MLIDAIQVLDVASEGAEAGFPGMNDVEEV
jgi:hypothetical protein